MDAKASLNPSTSVEHYDVDAVNSAASRNLYKARTPIHPKRVQGTYRRLKWIILFVTLGVYYVLPWVRWPRSINEPDQAILVDFAGGRFYFFSIELWPDELYYVTGLLILASLALFLVTALFGRVWCGYTCPQTVWTDLFIAVERFIEGDRNKRIKLAKAPWTLNKIRMKVTKHTLWILIAMGTGGAWVLYFHDAPTIARNFNHGEAPFTAYFFFGLLTLTTYIFAGSMREQVCTYMCPWPRIQAALTDEETLQVTYKADRGEMRGAHKKDASWEGRGDCVDCHACVAACPMGIDIRDGAQLECINCALCIDACDDIMAKVERPLRLIGYDTDANMASRKSGTTPTIKLLRTRVILYAVLLILVSAIMAYALANRVTLGIKVQRDRTPAFVMLSDGSIRNAYTVKIVNRENVTRDFTLMVDGPAEMLVTTIGKKVDDNALHVRVADDTVGSIRVLVSLPRQAVNTSELPLVMSLKDTLSGEEVSIQTIFLSEEQ